MFCNAALASNFNYISMPTKAVGDILSETIIFIQREGVEPTDI
jgi:uncharacterized protein (DUF934 family)